MGKKGVVSLAFFVPSFEVFNCIYIQNEVR